MRAGVLVLLLGCGRIGFDADLECPAGDAAGHCYVLSETQLFWSEARDACAALGPTTHLVTIDSAAENAFAFRFARTIPFDPVETTNHRSIMWMGGNDLDTVTVWTWITGEPFAYTNWRAGEPNAPGLEDCLIMLGAEAGQWDNRRCNQEPFEYLCERD